MVGRRRGAEVHIAARVSAQWMENTDSITSRGRDILWEINISNHGHCTVEFGRVKFPRNLSVGDYLYEVDCGWMAVCGEAHNRSLVNIRYASRL